MLEAEDKLVFEIPEIVAELVSTLGSRQYMIRSGRHLWVVSGSGRRHCLLSNDDFYHYFSI